MLNEAFWLCLGKTLRKRPALLPHDADCSSDRKMCRQTIASSSWGEEMWRVPSLVGREGVFGRVLPEKDVQHPGCFLLRSVVALSAVSVSSEIGPQMQPFSARYPLQEQSMKKMEHWHLARTHRAFTNYNVCTRH